MKSTTAVAIAALFATGTAFAQNDQPQAQKAPTQVAQAGGGASTGAGAATGAAGGLSTGTLIAIGAGAAVVVAATRNNETTTHH